MKPAVVVVVVLVTMAGCEGDRGRPMRLDAPRSAAAVVPVRTPTAAEHQAACDDGDLERCSQLGVAYSQGAGLVVDEAKARALYERACTGGAMIGCANLGIAYLDGTAAEATQGVTLLRKACDAGLMWPCYVLGTAYEEGTGVGQDRDQAAALYRKACAGGEQTTCAEAARLVEEEGTAELGCLRSDSIFQLN